MGSKSSKQKHQELKSISSDGAELKESEYYNVSGYRWANRYLKEIITVESESKHNENENEDKDLKLGISANLKQLIKDQQFNPSYKPIFIWNVGIERIEAKNEVTAYKLVRILDYSKLKYLGDLDFDYYQGELVMNTVALLEMKIDITKTTIKDGELKSEVLLASELKPNKKYVTGRVNITGVQFIGGPKQTSRMLQKLKDNTIDFTSNFDIHFRYRIGAVIEELSFGKTGIGCVQGIHFFIDKREAIKYLKTGFTGVELLTPVISPINLENKEEMVQQESLRFRRHADKLYKMQIDTPRLGPKPEFEYCDLCHKELWEQHPISAECKHKFHMPCIGRDNLKNNKCPICEKLLF
jgi:hypothetical protein